MGWRGEPGLALTNFLYDASALGRCLLSGLLRLAKERLGKPPMLLSLAFGPALFLPKVPGNDGDVIVRRRFELCGGHGEVWGSKRDRLDTAERMSAFVPVRRETSGKCRHLRSADVKQETRRWSLLRYQFAARHFYE